MTIVIDGLDERAGLKPGCAWSNPALREEMKYETNARHVLAKAEPSVGSRLRLLVDWKMRSQHFNCLSLGLALWLLSLSLVWAGENVMLTEVPDYTWYAGCFGTASGNLMGYWDRHGFPNLYTGPTAGGVAPLTSDGSNEGIRSMWATKAGFDVLDMLPEFRRSFPDGRRHLVAGNHFDGHVHARVAEVLGERLFDR